VTEITDGQYLYVQEITRIEQGLSSDDPSVDMVAHAERSSNIGYKPRQEPLHASTLALTTSDHPMSDDISGSSELIEIVKSSDSEAMRPSAKLIPRLIHQLTALSKHPYLPRTWVVQGFLLAWRAP
jgi:hypothetical protein